MKMMAKKEMNRLGKFEKKLKSKNVLELTLTDLKTGVNTFNDVFVCLDEHRQVRYVINRTCDHNGGRLIEKDGCAVCPLHGWRLDLQTLKYNNSHKEKEQLPYLVEGGKLTVATEKYKIVNPFLGLQKDIPFSVRWLNHATLYFECEGFKMATDPWLFGPAFMNGWWLKTPSTKDSVELLKNCDLIFISHNHPDHLHPETLSVLDKNIPIITGRFQSSSSRKMLERCGFTNITELDFKNIFHVNENVQLSVLKSGDFRDDSGLYLAIGGKEILLTVDSNFLNSFELPQNIFLLATSFASGASGFPLCFRDYKEEEKVEILKRNKAALKSNVFEVAKNTKPKYYMPYAGMFAEYARRDKYIYANNLKNQPGDYLFLEGAVGCELLLPNNTIKWMIRGNEMMSEKVETSLFKKENTDFYISEYKSQYEWNDDIIIEYLKSSGYRSNFLLQLVPADDSFNAVGRDFISADFSISHFIIKPFANLVERKEGYRVETIYVRQEVFMAVVENKLPWEDISIGFQISVKRNPNQYNSDFWYYFSNEYISGENYRHSIYCGACTVIEHNPIWQKAELV